MGKGLFGLKFQEEQQALAIVGQVQFLALLQRVRQAIE